MKRFEKTQVKQKIARKINFFGKQKSPTTENLFRRRRQFILVGGALRVSHGEVEIIPQESFVTIGSALLQLLPVSDTVFGDFFTLLLRR